MKKVCFAIVLSVLTASCASASVVLYEPFDGDPGALLGDSNASTSHNWLRAGTSTGPTAINVVSGSLTMPGSMPPADGNSVAMTGIGDNSGSTERLALPAAITSGTVYYSLVMQVTDVSNSNLTTGGFFFALNNTGNSSQATNPTATGAKIQVRMDSGDHSKYDIGVFGTENATSGNPTAWGPAMNVGDTVFIVGSYQFVASAGNDINNMWINPDPSTFGALSAPSVQLTDTDPSTATDLTSVSSILLRQSPAPFLDVDEIRVGTSWADVTPTVPEPASFSLVGLAAAGLLSRRKRIYGR